MTLLGWKQSFVGSLKFAVRNPTASLFKSPQARISFFYCENLNVSGPHVHSTKFDFKDWHQFLDNPSLFDTLFSLKIMGSKLCCSFFTSVEYT